MRSFAFFALRRKAFASRSAGGPRLGPAMARRVVEISRGRTKLKSAIGRGRTFCTVLPARTSGPRGRT